DFLHWSRLKVRKQADGTLVTKDLSGYRYTVNTDGTYKAEVHYRGPGGWLERETRLPDGTRIEEKTFDQGRGNVTTDRTTQCPDGTNTAEKRVDDGKGNVTNYRITKKPDGTTELSDRNRLWPGVDRYREHEIVSKMSEGNPGAASV